VSLPREHLEPALAVVTDLLRQGYKLHDRAELDLDAPCGEFRLRTVRHYPGFPECWGDGHWLCQYCACFAESEVAPQFVREP
jgi:hypothetical protein